MLITSEAMVKPKGRRDKVILAQVKAVRLFIGATAFYFGVCKMSGVTIKLEHQTTGHEVISENQRTTTLKNALVVNVLSVLEKAMQDIPKPAHRGSNLLYFFTEPNKDKKHGRISIGYTWTKIDSPGKLIVSGDFGQPFEFREQFVFECQQVREGRENTVIVTGRHPILYSATGWLKQVFDVIWEKMLQAYNDSTHKIALNTTSIIAGPEYDALPVQELKHKAARFDAMRYDDTNFGAGESEESNMEDKIKRIRKYLTDPLITDDEIIKGLEKAKNADISMSTPKMATGTVVPVGVLLNEIKQAKEDARHKEILDAIASLSNHSAAQVDAAKTEKKSVDETPTLSSKYDDICKLWVSSRSNVPYQNKSEFLNEHASELTSKTFDRILADAYKRGIIDKSKGKHGRYKPKTVSKLSLKSR